VDSIILYSLISLGVIGAVSATLLFFVAKKFNVKEDERIGVVTEMLPNANCGACGYPGCAGMADALVKSADNGSIAGFSCPPGGNETMEKIAEYLGLVAEKSEPKIAVIRCGGTNAKATKKANYDGPQSCAIEHSLFSGEKGCSFGCLGLGDCVTACDFDAIHIDAETGLPVVNEKCVGCGACVVACPRNIIELRTLGRNNRRVVVSCMSQEKGAFAMKVCKAACIGCGKCVRVCPDKVKAITIENNLAYIDFNKCVACGLCVSECPTKAITATFEVKPKPKPAVKPEEKKAEAKENVKA